jgi:integrase
MARIPKLCHHSPSGRGYATDPATRKEVYFGPYGSQECLGNYNAWIVRLTGRRMDVASGTPAGASIYVFQLLEDYLVYADQYYRKHGRHTSEYWSLENVATALNELHGKTLASEFRPSNLKEVRQALVERGLARKHVNDQVARIRRIWRWAVEHELVPADALTALEAVAPLKKGRSKAPEEEKVPPVPLEDVWTTVFVAPAQLGRMIRLQLFAAMRPQDVCEMRPCDIDRQTWVYTPWTYKTEHLDTPREIELGPKAREILETILPDSSPEAWLFQARPRGRFAGYNGPITASGYRGQIRKLCQLHGIPHWYPLQLRHTALSLIRERFGLEAAQVAAGHTNAEVTEIYAQRDKALARKIAEEMG